MRFHEPRSPEKRLHAYHRRDCQKLYQHLSREWVKLFLVVSKPNGCQSQLVLLEWCQKAPEKPGGKPILHSCHLPISPLLAKIWVNQQANQETEFAEARPQHHTEEKRTTVKRDNSENKHTHSTVNVGKGVEKREPLNTMDRNVNWFSLRGNRVEVSQKTENRTTLSSVQLRSVAQSCPTLCDPMNCSMPGLPIHHKLPEFTQTHVTQQFHSWVCIYIWQKSKTVTWKDTCTPKSTIALFTIASHENNLCVHQWVNG